jgi:hypothetical protein
VFKLSAPESNRLAFSLRGCTHILAVAVVVAASHSTKDFGSLCGQPARNSLSRSYQHVNRLSTKFSHPKEEDAPKSALVPVVAAQNYQAGPRCIIQASVTLSPEKKP